MATRLQRKILVLLAMGLIGIAVSLYYTSGLNITYSGGRHLGLPSDPSEVKVTLVPGPGQELDAEKGATGNTTAVAKSAGAGTALAAGAEGVVETNRNGGASVNTSAPGKLECLKFTYPPNQTGANSISGPRYMDIAGGGRLGNTMFEYAALVATAARLGARPVKPKETISDVFKLTGVGDIKLANPAVFGEARFMAYDPCIERVPAGYNLTLSGYYQSWRYFHSYSDRVRSEYKFKDHIDAAATKFLSDLDDRVKVGVHVRRGDMALSKHIRMGYTMADENYVKRAMDFFRARLGNPLFVVISDSLTWCRRKLQGPDVVFVGKSLGVDMAVMSRCNHSILTTGTFGWWGAWLAGGDTVYFQNFPKPGTWMMGQFVAADFFPPEWIPMT